MSQYIIQTRDLTKTYGEQKSVSNLNMHVRKGKIYGLLGRNGAGKTTTMKMLLNLIEPTSGSIRIFNRDIRLEEKKILPRIGSLIESPGFYPNLTGTENLRIFAKLRGIPRTDAIEQALKLVNLPYKDKKLYSQYSLGMKQRLAIALAVMHDPEILILDEPINGLDPIGIAEIRTFIEDLSKNRGKTILISSHILSEIAVLADDIGIIDKGVLIEEGSMKELEEKNGKYYFSRSENGESVIVSRPTPLITHAMISLRDNINIIWLGTNGGFTTSAELIENIEAMIDYMTPINKKYIVFGIHHLVSTVTETFETIEKNMAMHFGRHYINQRKYMIEYGLSDAGITPTVEDTTAISQGKIPPSLLYDDVHYNDKGYNIIATLASERGKELGYW